MVVRDKQSWLIDRLIHVFDSDDGGLWCMDHNFVVYFYNNTFYQQFDITLGESTLDSWISLIHPEDKQVLRDNVARQIDKNVSRVVSQYRVRNRQGRYVWIEATGIIVEEQGKSYMVGAHRNISEQRLLNEYLTHAAFHDSETGLCNRQKWLEDIKNGSLPRKGTIFAISIAHLNSYQRRWGLVAIQSTISLVVTCLEELFPNKYDIYRITQDVFAVWHKDELDPKSKLDVAKKIKCKFTHSNSSNSVAINDVAIGIVPERDITNENSVNLLLKTVEYAYEQDLIVTYQGEAKKAIDRHFMVSDALEGAIQSGLLSIALQPIIDAKSGELNSFEALARWSHSELGVVYPDEFIPVAERKGLIGELGFSVLEQACKFLSEYDGRKGHNRVSINVNVSVLQLVDDNFTSRAEDIVNSQGISTDRVVFEITESHLLDCNKKSIAQLMLLKSRGFHLSLDDFGTGLSSLTSLFYLPLSQIKIDKELVRESMANASCCGLIDYLSQYSKSQNISLVAEGVESKEMQNQVVSQGASLLQGFGLHRPSEPEYWLMEER
ncbi:EAL domain-containing protein [Vibrio sp. HN007]|uniref:GGDEF domain-containing phosphodiesterase n=1 Tax=Vibrio iocasae TaxID=3098914 RepID=UPI0035D44A64